MKLINRRKKRKQRKLRSKLVKGNGMRPRLVLFKSNRYLTAQLIDDEKAHTLIYLNTKGLEKKNLGSAGNKKNSQCRKNKEWAEKLGQAMVDKLREESTVKQIAFDRNGYLYHGKIKAFCDILRKGGIDF
jgi:large subunit ribosomal protein L18